MFKFKLAFSVLLILFVFSATVVLALTLDHPSKRRTIEDFVPVKSSISINNNQLSCQRVKYQVGYVYGYWAFTQIPELQNNDWDGLLFITGDPSPVYNYQPIRYVIFLKGNKYLRYLEVQKGECKFEPPSIAVGGPEESYITCNATVGDLTISIKAYSTLNKS